MYSYTTDDKNNKTAKGVRKNVIKKEINHSHYRDTLFNNIKMHQKMRSIRTEKHQISSYDLKPI